MSIDITVTVRIARMLDEVWTYVVEPRNEPAWISGIKESVPLTDGPIRDGSRVRRVASFMGRRMEYTPEVVAFDAGRRMLMKTDKPFPMTIEYRFEGTAAGSTFSQRLEGGPGGFAGLLSPLMAMMVRRNVAADMERLRRLLEADA
jgi:hypothetical protein